MEEAMVGNEKALEEYKYKSSREFTRFLDSELNNMNKNYFNIKPVTYYGEEIVSIEEIRELFDKYYSYMPLFRRSEKIKRVLTSKIKDKRDEKVRELNKEIKDKISKLSQEELVIERNNLEFLRRVKIREIVREVMNSRAELDEWIKHENVIELYKKITNTYELGYMDLAGILYFMVVLEGKKCKKEIKHVVIDEAQDYNLTQFKLIKELTGCKSFTIVGDTNQRLITTDEAPAMTNLEELFENNIELFKLEKSYRSTQEIMEYASKFLNENNVVPLVRNGEPVIEEEAESEEDMIETIISIIEDYEEEGLESIAIITKDKESLRKLSPLLKEKIKVLTFDREDILYNYYLGSANSGYRTSAGLKYKIFDNNIGYIRYESFSAGVGDGNLDEVLYYLQICNGLIIDVRDNGGGNLTNSSRIAARFTDKLALTGYIQHKTGPGHNDFSEMEPIYLEPSNSIRWQKKVVILTNRRCYSATNDFVNIMRSLNNDNEDKRIIQLGDQTGGGSGLPFSSELPNGWSVRFSASPHFDKYGKSLEDGIKPDVYVNMDKILEEGIEQGDIESQKKDPLIEKAFEILSE